MLRRASWAAAIAALLVLAADLSAQLRVAPIGERPDSVTLERLLRKLSNTGTFMETDAHPDDEDNALLAMLGEGRGMRTAPGTGSAPGSG